MIVLMRLSLAAVRLAATGILAATLLAGCQETGADRGPLAADAISVTSLDGPVAADAAETATEVAGQRPRPRPETAFAPEAISTPEPLPAPTEPEAPKSAAQLLCEKAGGQWTVAGATGANLCVKPTRDGGTVCRKEGDCDGQCLARSGTCAPFAPLFGCNEVLDKDGRRMTLCLE